MAVPGESNPNSKTPRNSKSTFAAFITANNPDQIVVKQNSSGSKSVVKENGRRNTNTLVIMYVNS